MSKDANLQTLSGVSRDNRKGCRQATTCGDETPRKQGSYRVHPTEGVDRQYLEEEIHISTSGDHNQILKSFLTREFRLWPPNVSFMQ
jgi:hypothetical protein